MFYHHRGLVYGVNLNICSLLCIPNHRDFSVTCVLSQLDTFASKKAWLFVEIQGEVRIGVRSPLWALERVGLRGICFSFCQLEFPFQIPFWLYDQATAVFMGGHSLAGGADLVRENFYFFPSKGSSRSSSIQQECGRMGPIWGSWGPRSETRLHPSEICDSFSLLFEVCPFRTRADLQWDEAYKDLESGLSTCFGCCCHDS